MSTMLERVAWAICLDRHGYDIWNDQAEICRQQFRASAKAALRALESPTPEMVRAAMPHMESYSSNLAWWRAMIQAALNETEKP